MYVLSQLEYYCYYIKILSNQTYRMSQGVETPQNNVQLVITTWKVHGLMRVDGDVTDTGRGGRARTP